MDSKQFRWTSSSKQSILTWIECCESGYEQEYVLAKLLLGRLSWKERSFWAQFIAWLLQSPADLAGAGAIYFGERLWEYFAEQSESGLYQTGVLNGKRCVIDQFISCIRARWLVNVVLIFHIRLAGIHTLLLARSIGDVNENS